MKKIISFLVVLILAVTISKAQIRIENGPNGAPGGQHYMLGDSYSLEKTDNVLQRFVYTQNTAWFDIGTVYTDKPGGGKRKSEACGIRVFDLRRDVGEDPRADRQGDEALIVISLNNPYGIYCGNPEWVQFCSSNWNSNEYEVVSLHYSIAQADPAAQWEAVMNASVIVTKKYNEAATIDVKDIFNNGDNTKIAIGVRAKNLSNPWASCSGRLEFTGTIKVDEQINITVENFFSDGSTGRKIKAKADSYPSSESDSPVSISVLTRKTVYAEALDKPNDNYLFNDTEAPSNRSIWKRYNNSGDLIGDLGNTPNSVSQIIQTNSDEKNFHYRALMKRQYVLTFENPGHSISVNDISVSSPSTPKIVEENTVNAYGEGPIVENGIVKQFDHWVDNTGQSITSPITATGTKTYTAYYRFYEAAIPNFTFGTVVGQPVQLIWTDNPNTSVTQYGIYRRVCINGVWGTSEQIGTVGRNVGTFSDPLYVLGIWKNDILLEYGMNAYYAPENHWSQIGYMQNYGHIGLEKHNAEVAFSNVPSDYSIGSYPNPFNPTTTINYQLPKDGMVTIKVYDVLGKEVATLVNEQKSAGYYKVDFDASKLTSGVYIAAIQASSFNKSIKLLLTK